MTPDRSVTALLASALLGVIAVASLVVGAFMLFGAWATQAQPSVAVGDGVATGAAALIGALTVGFAALAAVAARDMWLGRPRGRVLGLVSGLAAALAGWSTLLLGRAGDAEMALYVGIALALGATAAVLIDALSAAGPNPVTG